MIYKKPAEYLLLAVLFLSLIVLSGCAGGKKRVRGKALYDLKKEAISVNGERYVSLSRMCSIYGITWDYDPISYRVVLKKDVHKAIVMANSESYILDSRYYVHLKPVILYKDNIYVPFSMVEDKFDKVFNPYYYKGPSVVTYSIKKIVIDAGHGGKDPGAVGRKGLKEKDVVLDVSRRLKNILEADGFEVEMTRNKDTFVSLTRRAKTSNKIKPDFFISIHANAAKNRSACGFEVYYLSDAMDDNARAVAAAENAVLELEDEFELKHSNALDATVWDLLYDEYRLESKEMAASLCQSLQCDSIGKNRGVKSARFYVLKGVRSPSVLIEVGFISNTSEESRLRSSSFRQEIAEALAKGIISYRRRYEETDGFTN